MSHGGTPAIAMSDTLATPSAKLHALGRFLLATHRHEARADEAQPWLLHRAPSCPACDALRAALGLETAPTSGETAR